MELATQFSESQSINVNLILEDFILDSLRVFLLFIEMKCHYFWL